MSLRSSLIRKHCNQSKQEKDNYQPENYFRKSKSFPLSFSPAMKAKPFSLQTLSASTSTSAPVLGSERDFSISNLSLSFSLHYIAHECCLLWRAFLANFKDLDSFWGQLCMFEWDNLNAILHTPHWNSLPCPLEGTSFTYTTLCQTKFCFSNL